MLSSLLLQNLRNWYLFSAFAALFSEVFLNVQTKKNKKKNPIREDWEREN